MELYERKYYGIKAKLNEKIKIFFTSVYDHQRTAAYLAALLMLIMGLLIYYLNAHTTMIVDDYGYSFSWVTGKRIASVQDIVISQYKHYFSWGGRSVVHFLAQYFLMFDKSVFNFANTIAYLILVCVVYLHAIGRFKIYPAFLAIINFAFFTFMPAFGQVFLWLVGACNYLWGPLLTFAYLLPYRFQFRSADALIKNKLLAFVFGLLGIAAAWTNENLGVTAVCFIALSNLLYYLKNKTVYLWSVFGLCGACIGAALLILAPGNYVRLATFHSINYARNFVNITKLFFEPEYLLLPVALMLILYVLIKKQIDISIAALYLIGFLVSMYSMAAAPYYADRAKLGSLLFCLILIGYFYTKIETENLDARKVISIFTVCLLIMIGKDFNAARKDIRAYELRNNEKVEYALQEKSKGNLDIVLPRNYPQTKYCAAWGLEDINKNPKHWTCTGFARYFGLRTVRTK
ncbi:MAG: DUF6056 family protein [Phascolarctobacterium sp.]|uniref:DUF3329 domain-containing protein n=1 Tax=Phascolarctobacterium sp. TaxID=2049039 RepID=UPI0026DAD96F|nr:DUF6056 family protein [Phascolarctobacterium sp.]MDO4920999.1 DUF6056 family protein [Phascolarctobacterium sp.]